MQAPLRAYNEEKRMNLMKKIVLALMAAGMLVAVLLETAPA
ncbi:hypothetical protein [Mesorhizobium amorphae]|nr:hypothetical protein [Mesorhizobium amorphae]